MSFFARLTASFRAFPEYQNMLNEVKTQQKEDLAMADQTAKAFNGEEFSRYASKQKPAFQKPLYEVIQVGISREKHMHQVARETATFANDLAPILSREEDILRWKKLAADADAAAVKAERNAAAAQTKLKQAEASGNAGNISKYENEYARLKRAAEDSRASADHTKAQVAEKEEPYKRQLLELFTAPLSGYIECRLKATEDAKRIGQNMKAAAEQIEFYEDPKLVLFREKLEELEKVEREEWGEVYEVNPVKDFK